MKGSANNTKRTGRADERRAAEAKKPKRGHIRVTTTVADAAPIDVESWARDLVATLMELEGIRPDSGERLQLVINP